MSLHAYQSAATRAEDPRATEYRLFAQVTRSLMDAKELPAHAIQDKVKALDWNRRVWSNLAIDCASEGNQLPQQLRASIISLSIFVSKHSSAVIRDGEDIDVLVDINRTIMQGLAPQNTAGDAGSSAAVA